MPVFVQFPHPRDEHKPPASGRDMPWNVGDHARKFLVTRGRYVGEDFEPHDEELAFWGEWEPPSRIEQRWDPANGLPRALHRPYWMTPASSTFRQNTDPWVFGPTMLYSNCRQAGRMKELAAGSVICFGSTIAGQFCVDTVFVVAASGPWSPAQADRVTAEDAFIVCTAQSLATSRRDGQKRYRLYRGATFEDPVHGMFCFVPARLARSASVRFRRPAITLPGFINPASTRGPRGVRHPLPVSRVSDAWSEIRRQVIADGLLTAVHLDTPEEAAGTTSIKAAGRAHC